MCSACNGGEWGSEREQSSADFSFLAPIFGFGESRRRRDYQTPNFWATGVTNARQFGVLPRLLPVAEGNLCLRVYYRLEDSILTDSANKEPQTRDLLRAPAEIVVNRHVIVEVYRDLERKYSGGAKSASAAEPADDFDPAITSRGDARPEHPRRSSRANNIREQLGIDLCSKFSATVCAAILAAAMCATVTAGIWLFAKPTETRAVTSGRLEISRGAVELRKQ